MKEKSSKRTVGNGSLVNLTVLPLLLLVACATPPVDPTERLVEQAQGTLDTCLVLFDRFVAFAAVNKLPAKGKALALDIEINGNQWLSDFATTLYEDDYEQMEIQMKPLREKVDQIRKYMRL